MRFTSSVTCMCIKYIQRSFWCNEQIIAKLSIIDVELRIINFECALAYTFEHLPVKEKLSFVL